MDRRRAFLQRLVVLFLAGFLAFTAEASFVYPQIFTSNGGYYNSPDLNLFVEVSDGGSGQVDFTFHNESTINSCIASIYFDDGSLSEIAGIINGSGTLFSQPATPSGLPAGHTLNTPFVTTDTLSVSAEAPPPQNGINPGEWVKITFNLADGKTFGNIIDELSSGSLRIGEHIIALPDGSSESAVTIPEPMTTILLGLGAGLTGWRRIRYKLPAAKK